MITLLKYCRILKLDMVKLDIYINKYNKLEIRKNKIQYLLATNLE